MRMWMVDPGLLCKKHLLGEHVECHMLDGSLRRRRSIAGFLDRGLLEPSQLQARHDALADEMVRRGMQHASPLDAEPWRPEEHPDVCEQDQYVDDVVSLRELSRRCSDCRSRIVNRHHGGMDQ